jgi:integrase/recombinase XerC
MSELIDAYEKHLRRLDRSPNTVETYIRTLRQADRELEYGLECATTEEFQEWLFSASPARRGGGVRGRTTRGHYVRILKGWGKWAVHPKTPARIRLDFDATADLPEFKPSESRSKPTREDLLNAIRERAPQRQKVWILLGGWAGTRCCEISNLDREDITEERIWVRGKGEKERYIPTHPLIWEAVKDLPPGPIAVDHDGVTRLTARQVGHRGGYTIRKIARELGYPATSMHKLRHRFGTKTYDAVRDVFAVQELLGHSDPKTTRRYVEVNRDRMAAAVAGLPIAG